jgi:hypothetical protein
VQYDLADMRESPSLRLQEKGRADGLAYRAWAKKEANARRIRKARHVYNFVRLAAATQHCASGSAGEDEAAAAIGKDLADGKLRDGGDIMVGKKSKPIKSVTHLIEHLESKQGGGQAVDVGANGAP